MQIVKRLVPGLVAGSLVFGGASGVFAAKAHKAHAAITFGQVSNVSATGFTLTRGAKSSTPVTVAVTVSTTTKERALKGTTGALANGEYAAVVGAKSTAGIAATRVIYSAKARPVRLAVLRLHVAQIVRRHHRAAGTVSAVGTGTFSITTKKGKTVTFTVTSSTKVTAGKNATTAPTLATGERVVVSFKRDKTTKTLTALRVFVRPATTAGA